MQEMDNGQVVANPINSLKQILPNLKTFYANSTNPLKEQVYKALVHMNSLLGGEFMGSPRIPRDVKESLFEFQKELRTHWDNLQGGSTQSLSCKSGYALADVVAIVGENGITSSGLVPSLQETCKFVQGLYNQELYEKDVRPNIDSPDKALTEMNRLLSPEFMASNEISPEVKKALLDCRFQLEKYHDKSEEIPDGGILSTILNALIVISETLGNQNGPAENGLNTSFRD